MLKKFLKRVRMIFVKAIKPNLIRCGFGNLIWKKSCDRSGKSFNGTWLFCRGRKCWFESSANIGNFVGIAGRVAMLGGEHSLAVIEEPLLEVKRDINKPITIHDGVWVGYGVIIMHGVTIGEGAMIAAGAVVTKDVEPCSIVGGVPAKLIRMRFGPEDIEKHRMVLANRRKQLQ